ncbi:MAG: hypothetical protein GXP55_11245, partial [Deltaproteobacteria bacterium]|nr:hypothetical protein [Deltaproteobacteria bacterium]
MISKRHPRRPLLALALALWIVLPSALANADETHGARFPFGERAIGMGGAYTAVAGDPSASYYNPGGLAFVADDSLSTSLSVHTFDRLVLRQGFGAGPGTTDLRWRGRPALPLFVGVVQRLGKRDADGHRRFALALTTLYPGSRRLRFDAELFDPATGVRDTLRVTDDERVVHVGPSLAVHMSEQWGFGISAFLVSRRVRHTEDRSIVTEGTRDPVRGTFENATLFVNESLLRRSTRHLVFRVGALWRPTERLSFGLTLQPPGIEISDSARVRERRSFADTLAVPAYATFFESDAKGLSAASPIPFSLRVGAAFTPSENVTLSADFSVTGPSGSAANPIRSFGDPPADPVTGDVPQAGSFAAQTWHREWTVGGAVGMEALLGGVVPLRLGAYTDLSSAPSVPLASDVYQPAHVDAFGLTGSIGFIRGDYDVSVGVAARFGFGSALGTNADAGSLERPEAYVRRDMRERTVLIFFSGAQRTAKRVARRVYREHIRPGAHAAGRQRAREAREGDDATPP